MHLRSSLDRAHAYPTTSCPLAQSTYVLSFVLQVNSWHWQEKDILPWAKQRLQELLGMHYTPETRDLLSEGAL